MAKTLLINAETIKIQLPDQVVVAQDTDGVQVKMGTLSLVCKKLTYHQMTGVMGFNIVSHFTYDDTTGSAGRIDYNINEQILILKENPKLIKNGNEVRGNVLMIELANNKVQSLGRTQVKLSPTIWQGLNHD